ncbi:hypothetical protein ACWF94_00880 [Streptomyces sp. NPDC055078]
MSYPNHDPDVGRGPYPAGGQAASGGRLRPVLWLLLVIGLAGNLVAASAGVPVLVAPAFGLVALISMVTLITHHYRNRPR